MKKRIRMTQARARKRLTMEEVADHLQVDANTVSRWERGVSSPRSYNRQQLCELYGATAVELDLGDELLEEGMENLAVSMGEHFEETRREPGESSQDDLQQDLTLNVLDIVWNWPRENPRYDELQQLIMQKTEDKAMIPPSSDSISRRDALRRLAYLPIKFCGLTTAAAVLTHPIEDILTQCVSGITACWYLRKGKELHFAFDTIAAYIPTLRAITTLSSASSSQRKTAAGLLVQSRILQTTLARHVKNNEAAIWYAQQAEKYSDLTGNTLYQILSQRTLIFAYYDSNYWDLALTAAEKARFLLEHTRSASIPFIAQSYVYGGLATMQAHHQQEEEALASLGLAHKTFFAQSPDETVPIWIDHNLGNLVLLDGETHLYLGKAKGASDSFSQITRDYGHLHSTSETIRIKALIEQMMAEIEPEEGSADMERCIDLWMEGIEATKRVQSQARFSEALLAYNVMKATWPKEQRVKDLRDLIVHWKIEN